MKGYRTLTGFAIVVASALYQTYWGPLPILSPEHWMLISGVFGFGMRLITNTAVGQKE